MTQYVDVKPVRTIMGKLSHGCDLLKELTVSGTAPVIGYALAGLVASVGSSVIHPILEWLKTLNANQVTKTSTVTTVSKPVS